MYGVHGAYVQVNGHSLQCEVQERLQGLSGSLRVVRISAQAGLQLVKGVPLQDHLPLVLHELVDVHSATCATAGRLSDPSRCSIKLLV